MRAEKRCGLLRLGTQLQARRAGSSWHPPGVLHRCNHWGAAPLQQRSFQNACAVPGEGERRRSMESERSAMPVPTPLLLNRPTNLREGGTCRGRGGKRGGQHWQQALQA